MAARASDVRFRGQSGHPLGLDECLLMTRSRLLSSEGISSPFWYAKLSRCVLSLEANMRRREFSMLLGGAAVWPALALAQQNDKKRLVGLIAAFNDKEMTPLVAAFRARMQELGWIEGQNVVFDVSATSGDYAKLDAEAVRLVSGSADVIVAQGTPGLVAARKSTRTIPIVFTQVADPVGQRLIDSLAHPGGNATGLTNFEFAFGAKWVELLADFDPAISHVTLITNPAN